MMIFHVDEENLLINRKCCNEAFQHGTIEVCWIYDKRN